MLNFENTNIRPEIQNSLNRYIKHGVAPGSFVAAVIANDLLTAVAHSDDLSELRSLCFFIADNFDSNAHGSYLKMNEYMKQRVANGHI